MKRFSRAKEVIDQLRFVRDVGSGCQFPVAFQRIVHYASGFDVPIVSRPGHVLLEEGKQLLRLQVFGVGMCSGRNKTKQWILSYSDGEKFG